MMSVQMKKSHEIVKKIDASLLATDQRFQQVVRAIHEEGTTLFFKSAFYLVYTDKDDDSEWIMIFTEHHGSFLYPKDDLIECNQYICLAEERYIESNTSL